MRNGYTDHTPKGVGNGFNIDQENALRKIAGVRTKYGSILHAPNGYNVGPWFHAQQTEGRFECFETAGPTHEASTFEELLQKWEELTKPR